MLRRFIDANIRIARALDQRLPDALTLDGNKDFRANFARRYLKPNSLIYDIGGGKQPFLSAEEKAKLGCKVIGLDISQDELSRAPTGSYDSSIATDITSYSGLGDGDLAICQAVLEHVDNVPDALKAVASMLKPGGIAVLFVPCRNAAFARLNLIMPESLKRRVLFAVFPAKSESQGFPAKYDRCTPSAILNSARASGLRGVELKRYYASSYFSFFAPLYLVWRLWTLIASRASDLCETFSVALVKG